MFSFSGLVTDACKFPQGARIRCRGINDLKAHQRRDVQSVPCGRFDKWQFYVMYPFVLTINAIA